MAKLAQKKVSTKKKAVAKAKKPAARAKVAKKVAKAKKPAARAKVAKKVAKAKKPVARAKVARKATKAKKPVARAKVAKKVAKAKKPVAGAKLAVAKAQVPATPPKRDAKPTRHPKRSRGPGVQRKDGGAAFLPDPADHGGRRVKDDLAEELGEEYVAAATGEATDDSRDAPVTEEEGGPFITTSADSQYAPGTDESNPEDALREPFPLTHGGP